MTLQKITDVVGGVPTPAPSDEDKALVANGSGGYYWGSSVATLPTINAEDVSFDNVPVKMQNNPTEVQAALAEAFRNIPATKISKMPEEGFDTNHDYFYASPVIREDGQLIHIGSCYHSSFGSIVIGNFSSPQWSLGKPFQVSFPQFGIKVHSIVKARYGYLVVTNDPVANRERAKLWITGYGLGTGALSQVNVYSNVYTAPNDDGRITQVFGHAFYNNWPHNCSYVTDAGRLYVAGNNTYYQLGKQGTQGATSYSFAEASGGVITYAANQKVTRTWTTGLSSWAEVLVDSTAAEEAKVYKLAAVGYNNVGQLGVNAVGASVGSNLGLLSVQNWTFCRTASAELQSVGGPFKKVMLADDTNNIPAIVVLTNEGDLYRAGHTTGAVVNTTFGLVDSSVKYATLVGAYPNNLVYWKEDLLNTNGVLKGVGQNTTYGLGTGNTTPVTSPTTLTGLFGPSNRVVEISGSGFHGNVFLLTEAGEVYTCGANTSAGLGVTTAAADTEGAAAVTTWTKVCLPEPIQPNGIRSTNSNGSHKTTHFLGVSGTLYGVGSNVSGGIGYPASDVQGIGVPVNIPIPAGHWPSGH